MDGENGFSPYDPFGPGCDPFYDPACGGIGGEIPVIVPAPTIIIVNGNAAEVGSVQNAVNNLKGDETTIVSILGAILQGLIALLALLKTIWTKYLKTLPDELKKLAKKVQRILDKILKPMQDQARAQRKAIMDLYNKWIRPIISVIEGLRRFIHLLQIFHIHLLDGLDRQLAKLEWRIMKPFFLALYRVNTIGNWVSFILNARLLIYRGLFLQTMQHNQGGAFNVIAGAPLYGMPLLPAADTSTAPGAQAQPTYESARAAAAKANPQIALAFQHSPVRDLVLCWEQPVENPELTGAFDDLLACILDIPKISMD